MGHKEVDVVYMENFDVSGPGRTPGILVPVPRAVAKSTVMAIGCGSTHVVPYWSHEVLSLVIWLLLCIFPQSVVKRVVPRTIA